MFGGCAESSRSRAVAPSVKTKAPNEGSAFRAPRRPARVVKAGIRQASFENYNAFWNIADDEDVSCEDVKEALRSLEEKSEELRRFFPRCTCPEIQKAMEFRSKPGLGTVGSSPRIH